ncbi:MAG: ACP S-malonyltransferase [Planctomycetota bacterium]|nr:ACP S-malonyltransferase [Planctomycetota bacterium]
MGTPIIALCPGQGAQAVGMGRAWSEASAEARHVFEVADKVMGSRLGQPLSQLCFSGPSERLNQTDASQPAIFACSVASWRGMLARWNMGEHDVPLAATSGLSLGEYTALHLAGSISFEDGLELVALRGQAMHDATLTPESKAGGGSGMVALVGADEEKAQQLCDDARGQEVLVCANFNAPGQIVLSGHKSACKRVLDLAGKAGVRATELAVSGAFHSPLMSPAAERLHEALSRTPVRKPRTMVVSNVTGLPHEPHAGVDEPEAWGRSIRDRLKQQLVSPVRWAQSMAWKAGKIKGHYHELAPGKTLAGLMRRIERSIQVETHDEP